MFPIDSATGDYDAEMNAKFVALVADKGFPWKLREILPKVLRAGKMAGTLTKEGARLLDRSGCLQPGVPLCPPEGDAGTRNDRDKEREKAHRQCVRRDERVCDDCSGKAAFCHAPGN